LLCNRSEENGAGSGATIAGIQLCRGRWFFEVEVAELPGASAELVKKIAKAAKEAQQKYEGENA